MFPLDSGSKNSSGPTVEPEGLRRIALGGAFPLCAAHEFEEDGFGFRLGPIVRLPDGGYGIPLWIWDAFTGDEVFGAQLDLNYNYSTAAWRSLQR